MYEDVEEFLNKRAESHNSRYGYLPSKHCDVNVLKEIHRRHVYYCKLMEITSESDGHRMKPPYKISVYTEWRDDFDLKSLRSEND